ncbi:MAG TPA: hypothetical protein VGS79_09725 [Puia sp.]|nr:hypothetical protein [Puia sp.]
MNGRDSILKFLAGQQNISFGYSELNFIPADSLETSQVGYSCDPKGKTLVTGKKGDWQANWTVIANDETGDPLFVDTDTPELRVLTAAHGMGSWEAEPVTDSLNSFADILGQLRLLASGRANPVEKLLNPLLAREAQDFLKFVGTASPNTDPAYWETLMLLALENDTE